MNKDIITILIIALWFIIGFIYGFKIHFPMFVDLHRIDDEQKFDYITVLDTLFLISLSMLHSITGILSMIMFYLMQIQDKKIVIKTSKRSKDD